MKAFAAFVLAALALLFVARHAGEPRQPLAIEEAQSTEEPPIGSLRHAGVLRADSPAALAEIEPPARFMGDAAAPVIFSPYAVQRLCGELLACVLTDDEGGRLVVVPNPCPLARREIYAAVLCHELGHVNGWGGGHGD